MILAQTTQQTKATPEAIFKLWADINDWATYDQGIEWTKLDEPFRVGSHYTLKPKGGPKVRATILEIEPNKKFVDVSQLPGAKMRLDHIITQQDGRATVTITMELSGPMTWLWAKILGKDQQAELEQSTAGLIAKAEQSHEQNAT